VSLSPLAWAAVVSQAVASPDWETQGRPKQPTTCGAAHNTLQHRTSGRSCQRRWWRWRSARRACCGRRRNSELKTLAILALFASSQDKWPELSAPVVALAVGETHLLRLVPPAAGGGSGGAAIDVSVTPLDACHCLVGKTLDNVYRLT